MNPAPAELLQLLIIAALQPTTSGHPFTISAALFTSLPLRARKEKAALPEHDQAVRLVLFVTLKCILIESASHYSIGFVCP
jgi:hypothetical protein